MSDEIEPTIQRLCRRYKLVNKSTLMRSIVEEKRDSLAVEEKRDVLAVEEKRDGMRWRLMCSCCTIQEWRTVFPLFGLDRFIKSLHGMFQLRLLRWVIRSKVQCLKMLKMNFIFRGRWRTRKLAEPKASEWFSTRRWTIEVPLFGPESGQEICFQNSETFAKEDKLMNLISSKCC